MYLRSPRTTRHTVDKIAALEANLSAASVLQQRVKELKAEVEGLEELAAAYSIKRRSETNGSGKLIYLVDPLSREVQLEATSSPACCCTCV